MHSHDIIVLGASAGGVEALLTIAKDLPADFPAAVVVVLHIAPTGPSALAGILGRSAQLPVSAATDGEPLESGRIYVAPPDRHVLVDRGRLRLDAGPREHNSRPAVDPLFRSAADAYGPAVVGVVLSGALDDGSEGLAYIKERGGTTVVQDPEDADYASMPSSALRATRVDHRLPVSDIAAMLSELTRDEERV